MNDSGKELAPHSVSSKNCSENFYKFAMRYLQQSKNLQIIVLFDKYFLRYLYRVLRAPLGDCFSGRLLGNLHLLCLNHSTIIVCRKIV